MTFGITAAGVTAAAAVGALGMSGASMIMGATGKKGKGLSMPKPPAWEADPYYKPAQDKLMGYGSDLLAGEPNDYYKPIGEVGGSMFEDVIAKSRRDVTSAVGEDSARRGMGRSGATSNAIARAVTDKTTDLRWSDFLRAMEGRKGFMTMGNQMVSGVRGAGLTNQGQKNSFNLNAVGLESDAERARYGAQTAESQAKGDFWGGMAESGMSLAGMFLGKKKPAVAGAGGVATGMGSAGGGSPFFNSIIGEGANYIQPGVR